MKVKSVILVILLSSICFSLFANEQSKALVMKAKQYEANKKYAFALGTYYDAVVADPEESEEAYDSFQKLSYEIMAGRPGFGNFNEFTLYDNWVLFLKDAEAYWTVNCPYAFSFSELKKENVDFEKRTADYSCEVQCDYSEKYKAIVQNIIMSGIKMALTDSWAELKEWPMKSAFTPKDGTPVQIYQKYGVAIVKYPSSNGHDIDLLDNVLVAQYLSSCDADRVKEWNSLQKKEKESIISYLKGQMGWLSTSYYSPRVYYEFAPISRMEVTTKTTFIGEEEIIHRVPYGFIDIKLSFVDNAGSRIFNGGREFVRLDEKGKYVFKSVPANITGRVDQGDLSIAISGCFVNYGDFDPLLYDGAATRKSVSNLPDVSLSVKQFENENASLDSLIMRVKEKEAFEARKRSELSDKLYSTAKEEMRKNVCSKVKVTKGLTDSELINFANELWKAHYDSQLSQINKEDAAFFPKFDEGFANKFFEEEIKGKLYIIDKKGFAVLTKEGKKIAEQK